MSTLREAAQQALEALEHHGGNLPWNAFVEVRKDLRAALAAPVQEPVAWLYEAGTDRTLHWQKPPLYGAPLYTAPPRCPNCASLEAQNTELDRKLAEMEREPQTLDDAMQQPRAMAQAYENGYKAGQAHERKRIIQFLNEMQRQVGDGHNYYGVAAMRIREMV